jgi:multimeric flavodoxin WrbA
MSAPKTALLLNGSPKPDGGTSLSLGGYLLERLEEKGLATQKIRINSGLVTPETAHKLLEPVKTVDLIILAFPLYVDSLPAQTIRALQLIARQRAMEQNPRKTQFVSITNCGFAEAGNNRVALLICQRFAKETGMEWMGGLSLGMGEMIGGGRLQKKGRIVRHVIQALDLCAERLAQGLAIPQEAIELMARPFMPAWFYRMLGNRLWMQRYHRESQGDKIDAKPYLSEDETSSQDEESS